MNSVMNEAHCSYSGDIEENASVISDDERETSACTLRVDSLWDKYLGFALVICFKKNQINDTSSTQKSHG